jgi:hypothetical protein
MSRLPADILPQVIFYLRDVFGISGVLLRPGATMTVYCSEGHKYTVAVESDAKATMLIGEPSNTAEVPEGGFFYADLGWKRECEFKSRRNRI